MPQNHAGRRLLERCFDAAELAYLNNQPAFRDAVAAMQTLTDFENVTLIGHRLLHKRDEEQSSSTAPSPDLQT